MAQKIEKICMNIDKDWLKGISNKSGKNYTETVNSALRLYKKVMELQESGGDLIMQDKKGNKKHYYFI